MPENNSPEELLLTAENKETMLAVFARFFFIPFGQHCSPCPICGATYEHHRLAEDDFLSGSAENAVIAGMGGSSK